MAGVVERLSASSQRRDANEYLFPERLLGVVGDADLLFNRLHQLLVRLHILFGDGIAYLGLVTIRLDIVQIVIEQRTSRLLKGIDKRPLNFLSGHIVVLFAGLADEIEIPLA